LFFGGAENLWCIFKIMYKHKIIKKHQALIKEIQTRLWAYHLFFGRFQKYFFIPLTYVLFGLSFLSLVGVISALVIVFLDKPDQRKRTSTVPSAPLDPVSPPVSQVIPDIIPLPIGYEESTSHAWIVLILCGVLLVCLLLLWYFMRHQLRSDMNSSNTIKKELLSLSNRLIQDVFDAENKLEEVIAKNKEDKLNLAAEFDELTNTHRITMQKEAELQKEKEKLKEALTTQREIIQVLEGNNEIASKLIKEQKAEIDKLQDSLSKNQNALAENAELIDKNKKLITDKDLADNVKEDLKKENEKLKKELETLKGENNEIQVELKAAIKTNNDIIDKNQELSQLNDDLKKFSAKELKELNDAKARAVRLENELKDTTAKLKAIQNKERKDARRSTEKGNTI
jgi:uncharacterized membrane protein